MSEFSQKQNDDLIKIVQEVREEVKSKMPDLDKINRLNEAADKLEEMKQAHVDQIQAQEQKQKDLEEKFIKMEGQLELAEKQLLRPGVETKDVEHLKLEVKEFYDAVVSNYKGIHEAERKYYRTDFNPDGGYLAPPEYYNQLIEKLREISPVRQFATVHGTSMGEVYVPVNNNNSDSFWVGENAPIPESQATFEQKKIPLDTLGARSRVTVQMIQDSMFNIENVVTDQFVQSMAQAEGTAFVRGDGVNKPRGFLNDPTVNVVTSSVAGDFTSDDLMNLSYTLKQGYESNGAYMFKRQVMSKIRLFKSTNDYLWQPGLALGQPNTVNGFPYAIAQDMDDVGANLRPVAFGDWRRGYMIVERPEMRVIRDEYTQAERGIVRFIAHRRVGGQVVLGEAISVLRCAV